MRIHSSTFLNAAGTLSLPLTPFQVATGLMEMHRRERASGRLYPYPDSIQLGLNELAVQAQRRGSPVPQSISDLLDLCHRPLNQWPLDVGRFELNPADSLLHDGKPTLLCEEIACHSPDVAAWMWEEAILRGALSLCRAASDEASYVQFRRLLIEKPVLSVAQMYRERSSFTLPALRELLKEAYQPVSAAKVNQSGQVVCCGRCRRPLLAQVDGSLACEDAACIGLPAAPGATFAYEDDQPLELKRGLWRYVQVPGRAEIWLDAKLRRLGVGVDLWPCYDAYDLRLTFANKTTWAVDVKDWHSPYFLARHLVVKAASGNFIPTELPWHRAFFVFPNERGQKASDYCRVVSKYCGCPKNIEFKFLDGFVKMAAQQQRTARKEADHA